jgi:hypothetical protein
MCIRIQLSRATVTDLQSRRSMPIGTMMWV